MAEQEVEDIGNLRGLWPLVGLTFVVTFLALGTYIALMPVKYTSTSVVAFQPEEGRTDGRDLISLLIQTYPEFVVSESAIQTAASAAGVTPQILHDSVDAQIPPLTLTMTITTELPTPTQAQAANQSLLDQVVAQGDKDPYLVATAISAADAARTPAGPPRILLFSVAGVLSAGFALIIGALASRARHVSRVRGERSVRIPQ